MDGRSRRYEREGSQRTADLYAHQRSGAAARLTRLLLQASPEDPALKAIQSTIEAGRNKSMTDPEGFQAMLQDAVLAAVDLI